jgi:hypothetical protein
MTRIVDGYFGLKVLIAGFLSIRGVVVLRNVALRCAFNSNTIVSEEVARWLLVALNCLGLILAVREHGVQTLVLAEAGGQSSGSYKNRWLAGCRVLGGRDRLHRREGATASEEVLREPR